MAARTKLQKLAAELGELLISRGLMLATAESCTGGWVAQILTARPGSSAWFERGFVTYSNNAKQEMLGVSPHTLITFGAVSSETACEMAMGALAHSHAQVSLAITGVAGPSGATPGKPVGMVWLAWAGTDMALPVSSRVAHFTGDREAIRQQAVSMALQGLLDFIGNDASFIN